MRSQRAQHFVCLTTADEVEPDPCPVAEETPQVGADPVPDRHAGDRFQNKGRNVMTLTSVGMADDHALLVSKDSEEYAVVVEQMRRTLIDRQHATEESCCIMPPQSPEQQVDPPGLRHLP